MIKADFQVIVQPCCNDINVNNVYHFPQTVPVNFLHQPNGKQTLLQEGISYEHQYNCREDPSYPIRSKVQFS